MCHFRVSLHTLSLPLWPDGTLSFLQKPWKIPHPKKNIQPLLEAKIFKITKKCLIWNLVQTGFFLYMPNLNTIWSQRRLKNKKVPLYQSYCRPWKVCKKMSQLQLTPCLWRYYINIAGNLNNSEGKIGLTPELRHQCWRFFLGLRQGRQLSPLPAISRPRITTAWFCSLATILDWRWKIFPYPDQLRHHSYLLFLCSIFHVMQPWQLSFFDLSFCYQGFMNKNKSQKYLMDVQCQ